MALTNPNEVDELLAKVRAGDTGARDRLITEIYPELKKLAQSVMGQSEYRRNHTLTPTALVNQLWLKMAAPPNDRSKRPQIDSIPNSFALIWTVKKNLSDILTDHARARRAQKRPSALTRVDIEAMMSLGDWMRELKVDSLDIHQALAELREKNAQQAEAIEMKYILGYTIEESAAAMGVPFITFRRHCQAAEDFLRKRLKSVSESRK